MVQDQTAEIIRPLPIRINFVWAFLANGVLASSQWGAQILIAKLSTREMLGRFALSLAIAAPIFMFMNLGLRAGLITDAKRRFEAAQYLGLRLCTTALAILTISLVAVFGRYPYSLSLVIVIMAIAQGFEAISDIYCGFMQQTERMDRVAVSMIIKGLASVIGVAVFLHFSRSALGAVLGYAFGRAVVLFFYDIPVGTRTAQLFSRSFSKLIPQFDRPVLLAIFRVTLPLGVTAMLSTLNTNIARYFIDRDLGDAALGAFAAAAALPQIGITVVLAVGHSAVPRLSKVYVAGQIKAFRDLAGKMVAVGAVLAALGIIIASTAGASLLAFIYRPEYARNASILVWLMAAAGLGYMSTFCGHAITAARIFNPQVIVLAGACTVAFLASLIFIPRYGVVGAAYAVFSSAVVQLMGNGYLLLRAILTAQTVPKLTVDTSSLVS